MELLESICQDLAARCVGNITATRFVLTHGTKEQRDTVSKLALDRVQNRHVDAEERAEMAFVLVECGVLDGGGIVQEPVNQVQETRPTRGRPRKKG